MSLINDALKRASSTKPRPAETPTADGLQPVPEAPRGAGPLPIVLFIVGIGALLISGAFWLKSKGTVPQQVSTPEAASPPAPAVPAPIVAKVETKAEAKAETNVATATVAAKPELKSEPAVAAALPPLTEPKVEPAPAPAPPATAAVAKPKEPELKLHAIYYRMKGPTVVINGQTLKVGDSIAGGKLTAIERTWVEVEINGVVRKLTLQ